MSAADFFAIVERDHTFQNPTSEPKLDRLIEYCALADGRRVLDIGCGKAWLLRRMATSYAIDGVGVELRESFIAEAQQQITRMRLKGRITLHRMTARDFVAPAQSFDVATCIGASFAIGTFEDMVGWLRPFIKPGGVLAIGDIYVKRAPLPPASAAHFSGAKQRTLVDTADALNRDGLTLIGIIDSSVDDWDRYESLHWRAADAWARDNPQHPARADIVSRANVAKRNHIAFDRDALGWAMFVCRV